MKGKPFDEREKANPKNFYKLQVWIKKNTRDGVLLQCFKNYCDYKNWRYVKTVPRLIANFMASYTCPICKHKVKVSEFTTDHLQDDKVKEIFKPFVEFGKPKVKKEQLDESTTEDVAGENGVSGTAT